MAEMSNPVDVMGRELPYSQEAELAVIGSALTNLHSVAESVTPRLEASLKAAGWLGGFGSANHPAFFSYWIRFYYRFK